METENEQGYVRSWGRSVEGRDGSGCLGNGDAEAAFRSKQVEGLEGVGSMSLGQGLESICSEKPPMSEGMGTQIDRPCD